LFVYGDADALRNLVEFAQDEHEAFSANQFIPYPEEYRKQDEIAKIARGNGDWSVKDGFNSGGYEWCCANWGTKWGCYNSRKEAHVDKGKRSKLAYSFDSAWSPAIPVIVAASIRFPSLRFKLKYYECGAGFKGTFQVRNGVVMENSEFPYRGVRGG
jgi:hypothetical protein